MNNYLPSNNRNLFHSRSNQKHHSMISRSRRNKSLNNELKSTSHQSSERITSNLPSIYQLNQRESNQPRTSKKLTGRFSYLKGNKYIRKHILIKNSKEKNENNQSFNNRILIKKNTNNEAFIKTHLTITPNQQINNNIQDIKISRGQVKLNDLAQGIKVQYGTKLIEENGKIFYKFDLSKRYEDNDCSLDIKLLNNSKEIKQMISQYDFHKSLNKTLWSHLLLKFENINIKKEIVFKNLKRIINKRKEINDSL